MISVQQQKQVIEKEERVLKTLKKMSGSIKELSLHAGLSMSSTRVYVYKLQKKRMVSNKALLSDPRRTIYYLEKPLDQVVKK